MKKSFLILYTRTRDGRIGRMEEREDGDYMAFSVYGTFTEPEKGVNFFVIRSKPTKRDAFPRKLKTAINALALKERFFKVVLGAGYSRTAAEGIVEEWFEFYLQGDVSKFIAMLEDYERDQKEEKCEN